MTTLTTRQLRKFILEHFNHDDLNTFCFEYFPEVRRDYFAPGMNLNTEVIELIDYCDRRQLIGNLVVALQQERAGLYHDVFGSQPEKKEAPPTHYQPGTRNRKQIFVSHSSADAALAQQIARDLEAHDYDVFITPNSIRPGEKWVPAIGRGLEESSIFLVLLTRNAVNSNWVHEETNTAIALAHENQIRVLFLEVQDSQPPIMWRQRQFLSFRNKEYGRDLENLLLALQEETLPDGSEMTQSEGLAATDTVQLEASGPAEDQIDDNLQKQKNAQLATLHTRLLQAEAEGDWLNVLTLAAQIELLQPDDPEIAALRMVALQQLRTPSAPPVLEIRPSAEPAAPLSASAAARCEATTKSGERCRRRALAGTDFCGVHAPTWQKRMAVTTDLITKTDSVKQTLTGLEFVKIPAGEFIYSRGATEKKKHHDGTKDETGEGRLHLPEFWISTTPVTHAVYKRFIDANPSFAVPVVNSDWAEPYNWNKRNRTGPAAKNDHPIVLVSWYDAIAFCEWAGLSLPTEEEWEKAARGIDGRHYPWGNDDPGDRLCNFDGYVGSTTRVGEYAPRGDSPFGCVDMSGNVWEWCVNKFLSPLDTSIDVSGDERVLRGGSFHGNVDDVRAYSRGPIAPDARYHSVGFRVVSSRPPAPDSS